MSDTPHDPPLPPDEDTELSGSKLDELMATRRAKVAALRDAGVEPYPFSWEPTHTLAQVREQWGDLEPGAEPGDVVRVAGRLVAKRGQGKLAFGGLREDGVDLQLFVQLQAVGEDGMAFFADTVDVGDWLGVEGEVMATRRGELSVRPTRLVMLGKALRPLPDSYYGLKDVEQRYRQREVDLAVTEETRRVFATRSTVLQAIRTAMVDRGFVEVETPMLHPIPGGAAAKPFVTHHNTLDTDLYLRIAPELYLKRLIVGGMPRVFEINRSFRNEGMSPRHNPEFTMLESYQAYGDHDDGMDLCEALVVAAAEAGTGSTELTYQGRDVSLAPPFPRVPLLDLVREATGRDDLDYETDVDELRALCAEHGAPHDDEWGPGKLIVELYEKLVEHELWDPTFVTEYPVEVSPLARRHRSKPHVTERFELLITGREMANGFSELIDPDDQRERFEAQARAKAAGDEEAMAVDEPYLRAMEHGMPPTVGLGLGIDRVVMLVTDAPSIRDVILFPTLRPEAR